MTNEIQRFRASLTTGYWDNNPESLVRDKHGEFIKHEDHLRIVNDLKLNNPSFGHSNKFKQFPVGSPFIYKNKSIKDFEYGEIIGYGVNPTKELVFKVRWLVKNTEQLLHPKFVQPIESE